MNSIVAAGGSRVTTAFTPSMLFRAFSTCVRQWLHIIPSTLNVFFISSLFISSTCFDSIFVLSGLSSVWVEGMLLRETVPIFLRFRQQAVADDAHAAECHGGTRDHRVEQKAIDRVQYACRDRYADQVINECPKQILPDGFHGELGEADGFRDFHQVGRRGS